MKERRYSRRWKSPSQAVMYYDDREHSYAMDWGVVVADMRE
jgi:hypothetical protein